MLLEKKPIGITRVNNPPAMVKDCSKEVPSACQFWIMAQEEMFYASAQQHMNCPLGAQVMGFELPKEKQEELQGLVEQMCDLCYIDPEEGSQIPKFKETKKGAIYGPLKEFQFSPDIVLICVTPKTNMLIKEAFGQTQWNQVFEYPTFGRPGCGILPIGAGAPNVVTSFGCTGMRINTEIPDRLMPVVFAGNKLELVVSKCEEIIKINQRMTDHYREVITKVEKQ